MVPWEHKSLNILSLVNFGVILRGVRICHVLRVLVFRLFPYRAGKWFPLCWIETARGLVSFLAISLSLGLSLILDVEASWKRSLPCAINFDLVIWIYPVFLKISLGIYVGLDIYIYAQVLVGSFYEIFRWFLLS